MVGKVALLYRKFLGDYVVNERGNLCYESKNSQTFSEFEDARGYILRQFGGKKIRLVLDDYCTSHHGSDLEKRVLKAKIKLITD